MPLSKKLVAEFIGTFWLVLGGCGSAVLAAGFPELGIGFVGVSLAFGLTVLTMAYAIGHISGCHLNPAVSFGLWTSGRFATKELVPYIVAQVLGGIAGAGILYLIASGKAGFDVTVFEISYLFRVSKILGKRTIDLIKLFNIRLLIFFVLQKMIVFAYFLLSDSIGKKIIGEV